MDVLLEIGVPIAVGVGVEHVFVEEVVIEIGEELGEVHGDTERVGLDAIEAGDYGLGEIDCGEGGLGEAEGEQGKQQEDL